MKQPKSKIDTWVLATDKDRLKALSVKLDRTMTTLIKDAIKLLFERHEKDL